MLCGVEHVLRPLVNGLRAVLFASIPSKTSVKRAIPQLLNLLFFVFGSPAPGMICDTTEDKKFEIWLGLWDGTLRCLVPINVQRKGPLLQVSSSQTLFFDFAEGSFVTETSQTRHVLTGPGRTINITILLTIPEQPFQKHIASLPTLSPVG